MGVVHHAKPSILDHIPRDRHVVIEASAGTGKTYTLEHLVVDLLLTEEVTLENILVVTFTEKATTELRARVRALIARILAAGEDATAPGAPDDPAWTIDAGARRRLEAALGRFDLAPIHTIHAFCQRVLTENAFGHDRLFEQELVDGRKLFGEVLRRVERSRFSREEPYRTLLGWWIDNIGLEDLEKELYDAVRKHVRIRNAIPLDAFMASVQATTELLADSAAFDRLLGDLATFRKADGKAVAGQTRKALAWRFEALGAAGRRMAATGDPFREWSRLRKEVDWIAERREAIDFGPHSAHVDAVLGIGDTLKRLRAVALDAFRDVAARAFRREKEARGLYDFGDMLDLVDESLQGENGPALVASLRSRYRFALIDEFQDTDKVQWHIFQTLFFPEGGGHRLVLVGDPKQAIYGFRGADVYTYLQAREEIEKAGGRRVPLTRNYRSTGAMIDAVNALLLRGDGTDAFFTGGRIGYDHPVDCGRKTLRARDRAGRDVKPLGLLRLEKGEVRGQERLGRAIAAEIRRLAGDEESALRFGDEPHLGPIGYGDIFVLTRSNAECATMGDHLRDAGVPFAFFRRDGLFETEEATEIRDLLKAIESPFDRSHRQKAWITPFFGVPLGEVERGRDLDESHPLFRRLVNWRETAGKRDWERLFPRILDESGVLRREVFLRENERKLTNYLHVFEVLLEEASRYRWDLGTVIATLESYRRGDAAPPGEDSTQQRLESEANAVQVMSMHKAKGLEAAVVFLYGGFGKGRDRTLHVFHEEKERGGRFFRVMHAGSLDATARELNEREQREEAQRLYYVAMTRAKARLYLPWIGEGALGRFDGIYLELNGRLNTFADDPANASHFDRIDVPDGAPAGAERPEVAYAAWSPPEDAIPAPAGAVDFEDLREQHAAFVISSYSRMKQARRGAGEPGLELSETEERGPGDEEAEAAAPAAPVVPEEDALEGGPATGRFLHEVLERLDLTTARGAAFETWRELPAVKRLFDEALVRHDRDSSSRAPAERLVFTAITTPVRLGEATLDGGFAALDPVRIRREMEFLYPIPEASHPALDAAPGEGDEAGFQIERGYLKGFVDMVFEHSGRVYFVDWKTDVLTDYLGRTLARHVDRHYAIQKTVYSVAMVRWLRIRDEADYAARFGGLAYCFLRGMRTPGDGNGGGDGGRAGIDFRRPGWSEVLDHVRELTAFTDYA
jgi:exodeoxyribonuclease V beta subunit